MNILVFTKNWLGDILFQLPSIEMIRENYPEAHIVCMAPERCEAILQAHPAIDEVMIFDEKKQHRGILAKLLFAFQLRGRKWDKAFLLHRSKTRACLLWLAGAAERIGYQEKGKHFLTTAISVPENPMHQVDFWCELLKRAGLRQSKEAAYQFYFSQKDQKFLERLLEGHRLEKYICFHLGANWQPKRWPIESFVRLGHKIQENWKCPIVLTGAEQDKPLAEELMQHFGEEQVISLVGQTTLGMLGALYSKAAFVVSSDSGPMHIASGVGTRTVAIFGPTNPELTGPRGIGERLVIHDIPEGYTCPWYEGQSKPFPPEGWFGRVSASDVFQEIQNRKWHLPQDETIQSISSEQKKRQNILFITLSNIGDVVLTTPAFMAVRQQFPNAHLTVVAGPRCKELLETSSLIDELVIYDKKSPLNDQWRFICGLRKKSYDWVFDLRHTLIPWMVRAQKKTPLIRRFESLSFRDRHLELIKQTGLPGPGAQRFDFFSDDERRSMKSKLKEKGIQAKERPILVAPVAASGLKTWRSLGFEMVIRELLNEYPHEIFLVGSEKEREQIATVAAFGSDRIFNLAGVLTIREAAALVHEAALLIANDSAIMHLGFELRCPTVAIFGPTHHQKYGHEGKKFQIVREPVDCSPCEKPICRFERQHCFEDLSPEQVLAACEAFLNIYETSAGS